MTSRRWLPPWKVAAEVREHTRKGTALAPLVTLVVALGAVLTGAGPALSSVVPRWALWVVMSVVLLLLAATVVTALASYCRLRDTNPEALRATWRTRIAGAEQLFRVGDSLKGLQPPDDEEDTDEFVAVEGKAVTPPPKAFGKPNG